MDGVNWLIILKSSTDFHIFTSQIRIEGVIAIIQQNSSRIGLFQTFWTKIQPGPLLGFLILDRFIPIKIWHYPFIVFSDI